MEKLFNPSEEFFLPPFYEFAGQFNSLNRYWKFSHKKNEKHIETLKAKPGQLIKDFKALVEQYEIEKKNGITHDKETSFFYENDWTDDELIMDFEDNESYDINLFPHILSHSVTASLSKLFIGMLDDVVKIILSDSDDYDIIDQKDFWNPKKKFVEELGNLFGKSVTIQENKIAQRIEAFSRIGLDFEFEIEQLTDNFRNNSDLDFIEAYFQEISELTGRIESGCINYFQNLES